MKTKFKNGRPVESQLNTKIGVADHSQYDFDSVFENREIECATEPKENGMYQIDFIGKGGREDETEFTVSDKEHAREELKEFWGDFARDENIPLSNLRGIRCVGIDPEMEMSIKIDIELGGDL